jgi:hypothetical protein
MDKLKPKILDWLSSLVDHKFEHNFSDQWINVNIYDGTLSISLDFRQPCQLELFNKLPDNLKGCLQRGTGKLVNEKNLYFNVEDIVDFEYPTIIKSKLIKRDKHQESEKGGWYIAGKYYYSYTWELTLSDGTTMIYKNQVPKMDLKESSYTFKSNIQDYHFEKFIESFEKTQ